MNIMSIRLPKLVAQIEQKGFAYRGHFNVSAGDNIADMPWTVKSIVMVGHIGSQIWPHFSKSEEFTDGKAHPLDRFSQRIGNAVAAFCGGRAVYPSDPGHYPFMQWAMRASPVEKSRMQILIDAQYGLWHAYRYALLLPYVLPESAAHQSPQICQQCSMQPCLTSCPVGAYSEDGFDVVACRQYLKANSQSPCAKGFCQARVACPQGRAYRYETAHALFHMQAFNY